MTGAPGGFYPPPGGSGSGHEDEADDSMSPRTSPYEGMDDHAVIARAAAALKKAAGLPPDDIRRCIHLAVFDGAQNELARRFIAHVKAKVAEAEAEAEAGTE